MTKNKFEKADIDLDRVGLHKKLDEWLDEVLKKKPQLDAGNIESIKISGGLRDWDENDVELYSFDIEINSKSSGH